MKINLFLFLGLAAIVGAGCGSDSANSFTAADISASTPSGTIGGAPWTQTRAVVEVDSFDSTKLSVSLYNGTVAECDRFASSYPEVIFSVPNAVGEYPLHFDFSSSSQTATFVPSAGQNNIASEGLIVITAVSATSVTMGVVFDAGADSINGTFTTNLCTAE